MVKSKRRKIEDIIIAAICFLFILLCLLPMVNILARSFSSTQAMINNRVSFWPVEFTLESYYYVLQDKAFVRSLWWTALLTLICTIVSLVITVMAAYPLIYENLKGRRFFNSMFLLTMYFSAGTIPNYLLMKQLNLLDNPLVLIIPNCLSIFNMIILRSFFYTIPESLRESAQLDGAGPVNILIKIYLPLSKPALATLALFYAVGRWNGFSDALMYISDPKYAPIQLKLWQVINNRSSIETAQQEGFAAPVASEGLKAASVMFATVPILVVYPWLQRYFITGVTLGAIKE
ncbi:putative aldouronate transport system permease protein [Herbinix hemicellulosilytica]|mgnify:FL=1|uniref:Putative membrane protein n=1 Tax=Herbinix hemicellulosilytica TaxID=1564487 RepID=A0A0H5SJB9_HERHM|nr:carbohydrate ABC transporter permease [Herbinix hemicellulosilytica]RBP59392.1 putative aldouronate transport system permease protein [Herbinix hemicellulosilytica]CRZ34886.1 putative membrane protein [Herbinix hemicellulosilytica]